MSGEAGSARNKIIQLIRFSASSLIAFGIDYGLFNLLRYLTVGRMSQKLSMLLSEVIARVISATVNFLINRKAVFKGDESFGRAFVKYALLAGTVLVVNYYMMLLLTGSLGLKDWLAKIIVEVTLYLVNFVVQRKFVYKRSANRRSVR